MTASARVWIVMFNDLDCSIVCGVFWEEAAARKYADETNAATGLTNYEVEEWPVK